jgi:hypothetical protein
MRGGAVISESRSSRSARAIAAATNPAGEKLMPVGSTMRHWASSPDSSQRPPSCLRTTSPKYAPEVATTSCSAAG